MNVNVTSSKKSAGSGGGGGTLQGCFSVACCTIEWTVSGSNYSNAVVKVLLNNEGIGAFAFSSNLQNWSVPPSQVGNCQLNSLMIQGQTATPGGQTGSLAILSMSLSQNGVDYNIQNELLEAWQSDGTVLINNSNC